MQALRTIVRRAFLFETPKACFRVYSNKKLATTGGGLALLQGHPLGRFPGRAGKTIPWLLMFYLCCFIHITGGGLALLQGHPLGPFSRPYRENNPVQTAYQNLNYLSIKWLRFFMYLFLVILAISLTELESFMEIPILILISLPFFLLEKIAFRIQDPFENRPMDTAMTTIARTIELNIRQLLDEEDIPEPLGPQEFYSL